MKADATHVTNLLDGRLQFVVPIYQRPYSWTEKQCAQLFDDVLRLARDPELPAHFIGSIVYVAGGLYQPVEVPELLVIDGQQRLTTVSLLVEAMARAVEECEEPGMTPERLRDYFLFNHRETGDRRFKLVLSTSDDDTYRAVIQQKQAPAEPSRRVLENLEYFQSRIRSCGLSVADLYAGLARLIVVGVVLDRSQDNPQLIFESLNSTGLDLSQSDLVRNHVLMGLEPEQQRELYGDHWRPMEKLLLSGEQEEEFDWFLRAWLAVRTFEVHKRERGYEVFKRHRREHGGESVQDLVAELHRFARHYARVALGQEEDERLDVAWERIRDLRMDAPLPFFMYVRDEVEAERLTVDDAVAVAGLVESWLVRRMVCDIPSNVLSKTFPTLIRLLAEESLADGLAAWLRTRTGRQRFPSDKEFAEGFASRNFYEFRARQHCMGRLENHGRKEPVELGDFTIEHVLPQNEELLPEWREMLGLDWQDVQERLLHTIGNLTFTGYNSELSDRPFLEKRDMEGGFKDSPLRLSRSLAQRDSWDEVAIRERGRELAEKALEVWPTPEVEASLLAAFQKQTKASGKRGPREGVEHFEMSPEIRALHDRFEAGAERLGLHSTIWSYGVVFNPKEVETGYAVVLTKPRQRWYAVRLLCDLDWFEEAPEAAFGRTDRYGAHVTWVRAYSAEDIDLCLDMVQQVVESGIWSSEAEKAGDRGEDEEHSEEDSPSSVGDGDRRTRKPDATHFSMTADGLALVERIAEVASTHGLEAAYWESMIGLAEAGKGKPYPVTLHPRRGWIRAGFRAAEGSLVTPEGDPLGRRGKWKRLCFDIRDDSGVAAFDALLDQLLGGSKVDGVGRGPAAS